jgi:ribosome modulation factor
LIKRLQKIKAVSKGYQSGIKRLSKRYQKVIKAVSKGYQSGINRNT